MKAIVVREFGGPEVLKLEEIPTPKPAAGEVLVRIHAAGVNPADAQFRRGPGVVADLDQESAPAAFDESLGSGSGGNLHAHFGVDIYARQAVRV